LRRLLLCCIAFPLVWEIIALRLVLTPVDRSAFAAKFPLAGGKAIAI